MRAGSAYCRAGAVAQHGVVLPASFPKLVDHLHVFLGHVVAAVVLRLLRQAHAARGAVEIAGDDVPADAALGQVIERRHAAGEGIGRLVGQVAGDAEAEMLRGIGHGRHQQQRVVHRDLHRVADRGVRRVMEHVVDAEDVGQEQTVEQPAFQCLRQRHPMVEIGVMHRTVARMRPHPVLDVADAVHVERVEADLPGHAHGNSPRTVLALRTFSTPIAIAAVRCDTPSRSTRRITWVKARSSTW